MSDDESDYYDPNRGPLPARTHSFIANTELLYSGTSNGYHINKENILQDLAEKQFPLEDSELIFKPYDEAEDEDHFAASYYNGSQIKALYPDAWAPTVSIVFMPGLDRIKVDQMEEQGMTQEAPNQRSPRWRTLTSGNFLAYLEFDDNLTLSRVDRTPEVLAQMRRRGVSNVTDNRSSTALFRVAREDRLITIKSENVTIVNILTPGSTDLEATLIEVDKGSLFNLVIDFHRFVRDGGAALNTDIESRVKLLEVMIEDASRLAIRSPILFRMSTRQQIARSRNTRYGVDHGSMFETITTSVGIKNIISKSAACFNSLATAGESNDEQASIRPKFLQMLVLLLSLLNDADLGSIASFLEKTYRIKADRRHLEILILKVLPLQSINKSIFVREMVNAVETRPQRMPDNEEKIWNGFIAQLLRDGYVLPGFTQQMGQLERSWVVKFPDGEGFKDSYVFRNLQYHDEHSTINVIPPIDLSMNHRTGEVTSVLTDNNRYLIAVGDHQKITGMVFGEYSVTEAAGPKRTCDLSISEIFVNDYLNKAIQRTNHVLGIVNSYFATVKPQQRKLVKGDALVRRLSRKFEELNLPIMSTKTKRYPDIASCGRLTTHEAKLNGKLLAVAYKVEGKKIARRDLIRNMATDLRKVRTTLHHIDIEVQRYSGKKKNEATKQTIVSLQKELPAIHQCLGYAEQNKQALEQQDKLDVGDEPIVQTIFPGSVIAKGVVHWSQYNMRLSSGDRELRVEANRRQVRKFSWVSDEIAEVWLGTPGLGGDQGLQFFVSPLKRIRPEQRQWEIRANDHVLMVGQYIVVIQNEQEDEFELAASAPAPWPERVDVGAPFIKSAVPPVLRSGPAHGYAGAHDAGPGGHVPFRPLPQIVQNWMKVVGVPNSLMDPRLTNRRRNRCKDEFVIH